MKLIKILFIVIIGLVITNVTLTNRTVDEGVVVSNLTKEISSLRDQNTILASQVAELGSLSSVSAKLEASGYVETPKIVSLTGSTSVASR